MLIAKFDISLTRTCLCSSEFIQSLEVVSVYTSLKMDRYNSTRCNNRVQELLLSFLLTGYYSNITLEDEQHQSRTDYFLWDYPPYRLWWIRPPWECALKVGFFLPVMAVSIIGNGLVIYLMATNRSLRTSINIFIGNLATADLLTALFFPWIILVMDLYQMFLLGKVLHLT